MGIENMKQHREKMLLQMEQRKKQPAPAPIVEQKHESKTPTEQNIELRLMSHLAQLKDLRSVEQKIALKSEWLPQYMGFIEASLAQSPAPQNNVLMYMLVWAIDAQNLPLSYRIAQHGILNKMVMPEVFTRSIAELVADEVGEICIKNPDLAVEHGDLLKQFAELIQGEDLADQAHAKLYKAIGMALEDSQPSDALMAYKNALRLNTGIGVKTSITRLEKLLNKAPMLSTATHDGSHQPNDKKLDDGASTVNQTEKKDAHQPETD